MQALAPILGIIGFLIAIVLYNKVKSQPVGNDVMKDISEQIHNGAMAFLGREYKVLAIFIALVIYILRLGWRQLTTADNMAVTPEEGQPRTKAWIAACMAAVCAQLAGN